MAFVDWNDKLSVGVASIDDQHRQLVALINQLHDAMREGKGKAMLVQVSKDLLAYTKSHFNHEETLLRTHGYPELPSHRAVHDKFTEQVFDVHKRLEGKESVLTMDVMAFLRTWLTDHIMKTDQQYAAFLKQAGAR
jgi:hemerythrin